MNGIHDMGLCLFSTKVSQVKIVQSDKKWKRYKMNLNKKTVYTGKVEKNVESNAYSSCTNIV